MPSSVRRSSDTRPWGYRFIAELLGQAGVEIGGDRPWDIRLSDYRVIERVLAFGNLGLGEAYMDGLWECDAVDQFFARVMGAHLDEKLHPSRLLLYTLRARLLNRQTARRAWQVGQVHYDIGNAFYEAMLDERMTYSCGYWSAGASTLKAAQEDKLDLICRKLDLKRGMRLLDIGCGWGSLMGFAAEFYGVECVGVTVSREQAGWAAGRYAGLPVDIRVQDYRKLDEPFDRIASVGMFEHVGSKNYRAYMEVAHRCLKEDGLFLLHTIGKNLRTSTPDPWLDRYIFPNGEIPSVGNVGDAVSGLFVVEDLHNFGADYDSTLMAWHQNFEQSWPRFADTMGERFHRMWRYYLLSCAGIFRARDLQLWQWVLSKGGLPGGYRRPPGRYAVNPGSPPARTHD
ncbi:cyclopropane fatty acyl phospholipid synthase [Paraburkholderia sp. C35]|uniref:cyclopropane fatty acyl phospholipid synthase n=1 Tax=Paraburkholderia sp. C35 TaxID=2126993 RepID=UPI000D69A8AE|nr:cyclopropane fatty acyl phospholipid synthase [Paraburkholderia sp. C35]